MKVVILAGGYGTRLSEETSVMPKPMVKIGPEPIIWHIMRHYAHYGLKDFVVLCGYKGEVLKDYFLNFKNRKSDFSIDLKSGHLDIISRSDEDWRVTLIDTGEDSMTGGRIKRARQIIGDETFCLTYGDGVSNIPIDDLVQFHKDSGVWATVSAVRQPGRFGVLGFEEKSDLISGFREKGAGDGGYINGGFFVCEPQIFDLIEGDSTIWERDPMEALVKLGQLAAYRHDDFWQSMDTLRDRNVLEKLWAKENCPWRAVYDNKASYSAVVSPVMASKEYLPANSRETV